MPQVRGIGSAPPPHSGDGWQQKPSEAQPQSRYRIDPPLWLPPADSPGGEAAASRAEQETAGTRYRSPGSSKGTQGPQSNAALNEWLWECERQSQREVERARERHQVAMERQQARAPHGSRFGYPWDQHGQPPPGAGAQRNPSIPYRPREAAPSTAPPPGSPAPASLAGRSPAASAPDPVRANDRLTTRNSGIQPQVLARSRLLPPPVSPRRPPSAYAASASSRGAARVDGKSGAAGSERKVTELCDLVASQRRELADARRVEQRLRTEHRAEVEALAKDAAATQRAAGTSPTSAAPACSDCQRHAADAASAAKETARLQAAMESLLRREQETRQRETSQPRVNAELERSQDELAAANAQIEELRQELDRRAAALQQADAMRHEHSRLVSERDEMTQELSSRAAARECELREQHARDTADIHAALEAAKRQHQQERGVLEEELAHAQHQLRQGLRTEQELEAAEAERGSFERELTRAVTAAEEGTRKVERECDELKATIATQQTQVRQLEASLSEAEGTVAAEKEAALERADAAETELREETEALRRAADDAERRAQAASDLWQSATSERYAAAEAAEEAFGELQRQTAQRVQDADARTEEAVEAAVSERSLRKQVEGVAERLKEELEAEQTARMEESTTLTLRREETDKQREAQLGAALDEVSSLKEKQELLRLQVLAGEDALADSRRLLSEARARDASHEEEISRLEERLAAEGSERRRCEEQLRELAAKTAASQAEAAARADALTLRLEAAEAEAARQAALHNEALLQLQEKTADVERLHGALAEEQAAKMEARAEAEDAVTLRAEALARTSARLDRVENSALRESLQAAEEQRAAAERGAEELRCELEAHQRAMDCPAMHQSRRDTQALRADLAIAREARKAAERRKQAACVKALLASVSPGRGRGLRMLQASRRRGVRMDGSMAVSMLGRSLSQPHCGGLQLLHLAAVPRPTPSPRRAVPSPPPTPPTTLR